MKKNILYLAPYFWPEEIGSAPYCTELAMWLQEHAFQVRAITFRPHYPTIEKFGDWLDGRRDEESLGEIKISRVPVNERGAGGFKERVRNDIRFLFAVISRAIRSQFKATDLVVAYVPSILTVFGALIVKLLSGAKIVTIVHDIESGLARSLKIADSSMLVSLMQAIERFALNRSDQIVVLTDGMKSELQKIGCKKPISVISIWATPSREAPLPPSPPVLMYSGNFGKKQNLDQLLPLIKRLSIERGDVRVVMQGDGSEKLRIARLFREAGIADAIFLPLASSEKFTESLQAASLHMVPQALDVANYALPSKLFSIMAAGRPYVCIAQPSSPLAVLAERSKAGICVSPGDETALFEGVVTLIDSQHELETKGRNGQSFVANCMNKQTIMHQYLTVIEQARP
ncbi:colanic acid biosynthesis glycosyl transferase WcaI [Bradyrhizobium sp. LB9.1b]